MEVIIPTEIGMPSIRTEVHEEANAEAITKDLDTTDELREAAAVCIAIILTENGKLVQPTCKAMYIQSRGVSLKNDLRKHSQPSIREIPSQLGMTIYSGASRDS